MSLPFHSRSSGRILVLLVDLCRVLSRLGPRAGAWPLPLLLGLSVLGRALPVGGQERDPFGQENPADHRGKVLLYPLEESITGGVASNLEKEVETWLQREPEIRFIIFEINSRGTPGGDLEPVRQIAEFIDEKLKSITTIAHVARDGEARNGAALVALACRKLAMGTNSSIGFRSDSSTEVRDTNKAEAAEARALFHKYAAKKGARRYPPEMAEALISKFHPDIFEVTFEKQIGNNKTFTRELHTKSGLEAMDVIKKAMMLEEKKPVAPERQRLTLTAKLARRYGLADAVVEDRPTLLSEFRILVGDENILDHQRGPLKSMSPVGQALVDFLNRYAIRFLLLLGAFLGLLIEFKMPGTFIPFACSVACFLLFFLGGFFPPSWSTYPTTNVYELLLFLVGLGLVATEFFLFPGMVAFGLLGLTLVILSMILAMVPPADSLGSPDSGLKEALLLFVSSIATGGVIFFLLLKVLPRSSFFNRSGIVTHASIQGTPTADSILEAQELSAVLVGKVGTAITPLRPAGKMDLDGQLLDVVAEGDFVEKGERVTIIEATGFRAVVQRLE